MSLTRLQQLEPNALDGYRVDQILALAGEGRLKDGSACSEEFREYLKTQPTEILRRFIQETLAQSFPDSGFALQDLINEVGRRLGFHVEDGRYRGVVNRSGHDGLWKSRRMSLIVEVKTTDAYRINLTTVASYAKRIESELENGGAPLVILYVVGRQDTGDLEAQIRGSRHAWDVRVISAESLLALANLVEVAVDEETADALRSAFLPVEYTRIDHLVELLTKLAFDVERYTQVAQVLEEDTPQRASLINDSTPSTRATTASTPDEFRETVLRSIEHDFDLTLTKATKSRFETSNNQSYIVSVSKHYSRTDQRYWYAFQKKWADHLTNERSFLCLAMLDQNYYFRIPGPKAVGFTAHLNETVKPNSSYWHLGLTDRSGRIFLNLPKAATLIDLMEFKVDL